MSKPGAEDTVIEGGVLKGQKGTTNGTVLGLW